MLRRVSILVCLLALATGAAAGPGSVEDLAWISGTWRGTLGGSTIEEIWSSPIGGSMTGTFRVVAKDQVKFYEMLAIERGAGAPVMLIRHFKPGLIALEEKDGALAFTLDASRKGWAQFVNKAATPPEKLTYAATGKNGLVIRLEKTEGGKPNVEEFHFTKR